MDRVIEYLQKELERQNILIAVNDPMMKDIYPNMKLFRDELEKAIEYLKNKKEE